MIERTERKLELIVKMLVHLNENFEMSFISFT